MELVINEQLFGHGKTVSVIGDKDHIYKTGNSSSNPEACAKDIRKKYVVSSGAKSKINSAAFLLKAIIKRELKMAITPLNWANQALYAEFEHTNQDGSISRYRFTCVCEPKPEINYEGDAPEEGSPYAILPYVMMRTFLSDDEELNKAFADAMIQITMDGTSFEAIAGTFKYCDSFYWNHKYVWPEMEVNVNENTLSISSIKEARKMGHMYDPAYENEREKMPKGLQSLLAAGYEFQPCEELKDIETPEGKKKERKKREKKPASETRRWTKMLKEIKAGKYLIPYEWAPEQEKHIPAMSYLDTFVPTEEFYEILRKIEYRLGEHMVGAAMFGTTTPDDIKNDIVNILLYGDPGSGKTALVHAIGAATGMPVYSIKFNEDSEDDVFEGKNKIVEGKINFVGTDFLEGFEKGGLILMEEINLGRANMLTSVMNQALEYPFYVEKNGYEKITRHPLVAAFATMNLDTEGTMTLNSAMAQRFNNKYMVGEPSAADFKARLVSSGYPKDRVDYVYNIYDRIRTFLKETVQKQKYLKELSIRQCIAALNDMEEGTDAKRAVFNTMYGAICIKNRKLADQIKDGILSAAPDYDGE